MAQSGFTPILTYASNTASSVPLAGNLANSASGAELAVNTADKRLFVKNSGGTVVELGTNPSSLTLNGLSASQAVFTDGSKNLVSNAVTGTGNVVMSASPTLTGTISGAAATLSSDLTLSAGTANGVLYLDGSKVATSGSALTFDGTNFATTGGVSSGTQLSVTAAQSTDGNVRIYNTTTRASGNKYGIRFADSSFETNAAIYAEQAGSGNNAASLVFGVNAGTGGAVLTSASEQMRLTSTGLGIGTSSPNAKLEVNGNAILGAEVYRSVDTSYLRLAGGNPATTGANLIVFGSTHATAPGRVSINAVGTGHTEFSTGGAERMRLDSSGNLGLGVTPSAWGAGFKVAQVESQSAITGSGADTYLSTNWFYTTSDRYIANGFATIYRQSAGQHIFYTAPSGTAGNTISFTQAMTLDASGRLLIGYTGNTDGSALQIDANSVGSTTYTAAFNNSSTSTSAYNVARWAQGAAGSAVGIIGTGGSAVANTAFQNNFVVGTQTSSNLAFATNNTERARITSGGDLLVGTTSVPSPFTTPAITAYRSGSSHSLVATGNSAGFDTIVSWNRATAGDNRFIEFGTEGTYTARGSIDYNRAGGLVRYNTTSDYRAKDIIGPVQNVGATIDALKVYEGVMKGATQSRPMLIAHEAQEHAPYAVSGVKDEVNEDGTPKFQQMDVSSLVPLLLAEIQSLRARVAALEKP